MIFKILEASKVKGDENKGDRDCCMQNTDKPSQNLQRAKLQKTERGCSRRQNQSQSVWSPGSTYPPS